MIPYYSFLFWRKLYKLNEFWHVYIGIMFKLPSLINHCSLPWFLYTLSYKSNLRWELLPETERRRRRKNYLTRDKEGGKVALQRQRLEHFVLDDIGWAKVGIGVAGRINIHCSICKDIFINLITTGLTYEINILVNYVFLLNYTLQYYHKNNLLLHWHYQFHYCRGHFISIGIQWNSIKSNCLGPSNLFVLSRVWHNQEINSIKLAEPNQ